MHFFCQILCNGYLNTYSKSHRNCYAQLFMHNSVLACAADTKPKPLHHQIYLSVETNNIICCLYNTIMVGEMILKGI